MPDKTNPFTRLLSLIVDPENKVHGPTEATVPVGTAGGRTRSVHLYLIEVPGFEPKIEVRLFGNLVATVRSNGMMLDACGHFTPSTRDAIAFVVGPHSSVSMRTPGSRGGKPGVKKMLVTFEGCGYEQREDDVELTIDFEEA